MPLNQGDVFAGYTILRQLGSGGMGEVYLAQHPRLPRRDALKVLPASLTGDDEYRQRFSREADIAAELWHPHIVGIHDRGEFEGQLWLSMDYVEGTDAAELLRSRYPSGMPKAEVFEIVTAVADALDYAHLRGLLHRDVKPANILLTEADSRGRRILLADFGIARQIGDISGLTATNMVVGTTGYSRARATHGFRHRRAGRPVRAWLHRFSAADRRCAVPKLQCGGGHQPTPIRAAPADRRTTTRARGTQRRDHHSAGKGSR